MSMLSKGAQYIEQGRNIIRATRGAAPIQNVVQAGKRAAIPLTAAAAGTAAVMGAREMLLPAPRRRRSRGITSKDFRTTRRTLNKIKKMYAKLPKSSHRGSAARAFGGKRTEIVNVD